jgi:predicted GIY-YIG superfamily endonuclease
VGPLQTFSEHVRQLPQLLEELVSLEAKPLRYLRQVPATPGVYVFSDKDGPKYVGQTRDLKKRLGQHTNSYSRQNQATFAYRLALEAVEKLVGHLNASLREKGHPRLTRSEVEALEEFQAQFLDAKRRVSDMNVSFVEVVDPITRTLLEVYAALELGTQRYNSFETH